MVDAVRRSDGVAFRTQCSAPKRRVQAIALFEGDANVPDILRQRRTSFNPIDFN